MKSFWFMGRTCIGCQRWRQTQNPENKHRNYCSCFLLAAFFGILEIYHLGFLLILNKIVGKREDLKYLFKVFKQYSNQACVNMFDGKPMICDNHFEWMKIILNKLFRGPFKQEVSQIWIKSLKNQAKFTISQIGNSTSWYSSLGIYFSWFLGLNEEDIYQALDWKLQ